MRRRERLEAIPDFSLVAMGLVPWSSLREWKRVRDLLFKEDGSLREDGSVQDGLGWLHLWETRGPLPVAVAATRELLMAGAHQLALGCAVTRMVNGLTDALQGLHARNVRDLAVELELPLLLVDCRHEATHGVMPPMSSLHRCRREGLAWLWRKYWGVFRPSALAGRSEGALSRLRRGVMPAWSELEGLVKVPRSTLEELVALRRHGGGGLDDDDDGGDATVAGESERSGATLKRWAEEDDDEGSAAEEDPADCGRRPGEAANEAEASPPRRCLSDGERRKRARAVSDAVTF